MKKSQLKEEKITIRIETDVRKNLEKLAAAADKTLSHFIRYELKKIAKFKAGK